ncbi:uncharacterized protein DS421_9g266940 [Arachis hypogaea]|nr:uncharacterized protein DS421_9g266940 [Arachis hypogaea]
MHLFNAAIVNPYIEQKHAIIEFILQVINIKTGKEVCELPAPREEERRREEGSKGRERVGRVGAKR